MHALLHFRERNHKLFSRLSTRLTLHPWNVDYKMKELYSHQELNIHAYRLLLLLLLSYVYAFSLFMLSRLLSQTCNVKNTSMRKNIHKKLKLWQFVLLCYLKHFHSFWQVKQRRRKIEAYLEWEIC